MSTQPPESDPESATFPWWIRWFAPAEHIRLAFVAMFALPFVGLVFVLGLLNLGHNTSNVIGLWASGASVLAASIWAVIRASRASTH